MYTSPCHGGPVCTHSALSGQLPLVGHTWPFKLLVHPSMAPSCLMAHPESSPRKHLVSRLMHCRVQMCSTLNFSPLWTPENVAAAIFLQAKGKWHELEEPRSDLWPAGRSKGRGPKGRLTESGVMELSPEVVSEAAIGHRAKKQDNLKPSCTGSNHWTTWPCIAHSGC